ncbi:MAG TPA: hypothetical protein VLJ57_06775, partial [Burkholderiaceae bacterium]|nr:hypothetical protein [Burkholderiaceae bacterium]
MPDRALARAIARVDQEFGLGVHVLVFHGGLHHLRAFGVRAQDTGYSPPRMSPAFGSSFISLLGAPGALRTRARCGFAADQPLL